ncbi:MAG: sensor histidine kinase [Chloroflexota bacterium]
MRSLYFKLILVLLAVSLAGTFLAATLIRQSSERQFDRYLRERAQAEFVRDVQAYYVITGSLQGIERLVDRAIARTQAGGERRILPYALADHRGVIIVASGPWERGEIVPPGALEEGIAVTVGGEQIGTVLLLSLEWERDAFEQRYLRGVNRALWLGALGGTAIAVLLGALLAGTLTRPLREMADASHAMAQGQLEQQVPVRSDDELGELARAFNRMSAELTRITRQRRQMTADIAHDLRTPLTVLAGYLEAMEEGTLKPTPERLGMMQQEVAGLTRLVEDLRVLSLADADRLELNLAPADVGELLARVRDVHAPQAEAGSIALQVDVAPDLPQVRLDPARMRQVIGNLVSNALRHTAAGGSVTLQAARDDDGVVLRVQDTGSGIAGEDLPHIFDRFYRGDTARGAGRAASGLGLAIARSLVEMHGGTIGVESKPGEGSTFTIWLPT